MLKETGCGAIKLEGGQRMAETIRFLTERGVPVMAHVGLTPQAVNALGGFRAQGRDRADWAPIVADARAVAEAGAFSVVVEAVAEPLAAEITREIAIPTIGIGASAACDGQVLVLEDMLGLSPWVPKFVKRYTDARPLDRGGGVGLCGRGAQPRFPGGRACLPVEGRAVRKASGAKAFSVVIPGRPKAEPGIQNVTRGRRWIPGSRRARPGMTKRGLEALLLHPLGAVRPLDRMIRHDQAVCTEGRGRAQRDVAGELGVGERAFLVVERHLVVPSCVIDTVVPHSHLSGCGWHR